MSRYRLLPTAVQEATLLGHCAHARYVWNLAVEQHAHWHPGRDSAPGYLEQCRQLTQSRAEYPWLAQGSQTVQQQALRDFAQAMTAFFDPTNPARRPSWRKAGRDEGFRIVGQRGRQWDVRRLSRKTGEVWVPKAGWIRFRWSRSIPAGVKSYRVTRDKDWAEKASTGVARRFDVIRVEDLQITNMTRSAKGTPENPGRHVRQKAGLNRGILRSGWGLLVRRMEQKAPGRVERMSPVFTSQRCSACGQVDSKSRESQAVFQCTACGYASHADVNAARNIAAGHAVTARGGDGVTRPVNREPQLLSSLTGREQLESSAFGRRRMPTQPTLWLASVREQTSTIAEIQSCPLPAAHRAVLVP
jgi:putative transposase